MEIHEGEILTAAGKAELEAELENLKTVVRPHLSERIHESKEFGEKAEGGEYDDARNELGFVEGRIEFIQDLLSKATIVEEHDPSKVSLGGFVEASDQHGGEHTFNIVGPAEVDPAEGKISNESPVARALLGKRVGDVAEVHAPAGNIEYSIKKVW
ncbi:MAG: transcription elongation factor GreA [Chloroflexota bacterium]|jgi:transcription elongation factor GreA|nr:transcription elongation factor GreA [Chloroflexota bacterium]MDP6507897.1 transcription elongation factor GreA [Chloroflexota bacterium]|tara:strand:- start:50 stop:517 length:468 start_codon:yes stop_codon:yes gene_type:complete